MTKLITKEGNKPQTLEERGKEEEQSGGTGVGTDFKPCGVFWALCLVVSGVIEDRPPFIRGSKDRWSINVTRSQVDLNSTRSL